MRCSIQTVYKCVDCLTTPNTGEKIWLTFNDDGEWCTCDDCHTEQQNHANHALETFESLGDDIARWKWVQENQHKGILVRYERDATHIIIEGFEGYSHFDTYIGYNSGVSILLDAMGIKAEEV